MIHYKMSFVRGIISWQLRIWSLEPYLGSNPSVPTYDLCVLGEFLTFLEP